jgi:cell division protein FtsB
MQENPPKQDKRQGKQDKPREQQRKRGSQISSVQVMFAAILSIGLILAINFSARIAASQPLQAAYSRVSSEIATLTVQQAQLTAQRDYVLSDAYVEQWARSDGKMVRPGEVLVIPVPSSLDAAAATAEPLIVPESVHIADDQPPPWVTWWQIFFDSPPPSLSVPSGR